MRSDGVVDDQKTGADPDTSLAIRSKVERRLVWKQDLTMLPLLAMCFFFSYVVSDQHQSAMVELVINVF